MGDCAAAPPILEALARKLTPLLDKLATLVETFADAKTEAATDLDGKPKVTAVCVCEGVQTTVSRTAADAIDSCTSSPARGELACTEQRLDLGLYAAHRVDVIE